MTHTEIEYHEKKLYLKSEDALKRFNRFIADFGTGDKAVMAILAAYEINPQLFKPKMI